jgi:hypothetical protein
MIYGPLQKLTDLVHDAFERVADLTIPNPWNILDRRSFFFD